MNMDENTWEYFQVWNAYILSGVFTYTGVGDWHWVLKARDKHILTQATKEFLDGNILKYKTC